VKRDYESDENKEHGVQALACFPEKAANLSHKLKPESTDKFFEKR
jgi:hypothetical protein